MIRIDDGVLIDPIKIGRPRVVDGVGVLDDGLDLGGSEVAVVEDLGVEAGVMEVGVVPGPMADAQQGGQVAVGGAREVVGEDLEDAGRRGEGGEPDHVGQLAAVGRHQAGSVAEVLELQVVRVVLKDKGNDREAVGEGARDRLQECLKVEDQAIGTAVDDKEIRARGASGWR